MIDMRILSMKRVLVALFIIVFAFQLFPVSAKPIFLARNGSNQQDTVIPVIFDEAHLDPGTQNSLLLFDHETAMKKPLD
ncbi:MAG: hypothetical protein ACFFD4_05065, partial [Candidatus Odinarchaeota archaeon]